MLTWADSEVHGKLFIVSLSSILVSVYIACDCQIVDQCNDGARKMSNLEQMMEIDRAINFKSTKVYCMIRLYLDACTSVILCTCCVKGDSTHKCWEGR